LSCDTYFFEVNYSHTPQLVLFKLIDPDGRFKFYTVTYVCYKSLCQKLLLTIYLSFIIYQGILGLHQPTLLPEWGVPLHGFSGVSPVIKMEPPIAGRSEQAIYNQPIFNSCPGNVRYALLFPFFFCPSLIPSAAFGPAHVQNEAETQIIFSSGPIDGSAYCLPILLFFPANSNIVSQMEGIVSRH